MVCRILGPVRPRVGPYLNPVFVVPVCQALPVIGRCHGLAASVASDQAVAKKGPLARKVVEIRKISPIDKRSFCVFWFVYSSHEAKTNYAILLIVLAVFKLIIGSVGLIV